MNVMQLTAEAKAIDPALALLSDEQCRDLLLVAFRVVRKALAATPQGDLTVGGLGTFHVAEADGAAPRITFTIATPPAKKAARKVAAKKAAARKVPAVKAPAVKAAPAKKAALKMGARRPI